MPPAFLQQRLRWFSCPGPAATLNPALLDLMCPRVPKALVWWPLALSLPPPICFPRFLLMMGVLFCCGAGFFIRRRMYPPPLIEEPAFNVSYTRQPPNPGTGQPPCPSTPLCFACKHLSRTLPQNVLKGHLGHLYRFIAISASTAYFTAYVSLPVSPSLQGLGYM